MISAYRIPSLHKYNNVQYPRPKILITGATGHVGSKTIVFLLSNKEIELVAAVRTPEKAAPFTAKGTSTVILDFDDESTHLPALEGIARMPIVTGIAAEGILSRSVPHVSR